MRPVAIKSRRGGYLPPLGLCLLALALAFLVLSCGCAKVIDSRVTVVTDPPEADIFIDGVFVGISPIDLPCKRDAPNATGNKFYSPSLIAAEKHGYQRTTRRLNTLNDVDELGATDQVLNSILSSKAGLDTGLSLSSRSVENRYPVVYLTLVPAQQHGSTSVPASSAPAADPAGQGAGAEQPGELARPPGPGIDFGTYHALVIGNNSYEHFRKLKTAENDAIAVARLLEEDYGFATTILLNASRKDILRELQRKRNELSTQDNLLIYYAGHGWLDEETRVGYWMPVNADLDDPSEWISSNTITNAVKAIDAKHILIIADSCFSGTIYRGIAPAARTERKSERYWRRLVDQRARVVMTSGGLEPVADSGSTTYSSHSVFAEALLGALSDNRSMLDGMSLFTEIKKHVVLNAEQTPEYADLRFAGHEGGDFIFYRKRQR